MLEGLKQLVALNRPPTEILRDLADVLIVAFIFYRALLVLKGTRAMQMGLGFVAFGFLYLLAKYGELATLMSVLSWLASSAILIVVVVFQNDIRRALIRLGSKAWLMRGRDAQQRIIDEVVEAATELARHRMGALICLERDANVLEFVREEGLELDALVTKDLLVSLFVPEAVNKTHDGAVLIRDLRVARAGVFFPMNLNTQVDDRSFGSRHRAAIGITEETDAIVVVVSEERGTITLAFKDGSLAPNLTGESLRQALLGLFGRAPSQKKEKRRISLRRSKPATSLPPKADRDKRPPTSDKAKPDKSAKPDKPDKSAKPDKPDKGAKPDKPDKSAKPDKPDKSAKPDKPDKGAKQATLVSGGDKPVSGKPAAAKKATKQSGRFKALKKGAAADQADDELKTPPPPRVSVPMPSSKDRATDPPPPPNPERPPAPSVSKPMTPADLPATITRDDS